jgi:hypothetical protein
MERCEHEDEMRERLRGSNGLFVGLLSPDELEAFNYLCEKRAARRVYRGASGFMGLAQVEISPAA